MTTFFLGRCSSRVSTSRAIISRLSACRGSSSREFASYRSRFRPLLTVRTRTARAVGTMRIAVLTPVILITWGGFWPTDSCGPVVRTAGRAGRLPFPARSGGSALPAAAGAWPIRRRRGAALGARAPVGAQLFLRDVLSPELRPSRGDVLFFYYLLIHSGSLNTSNKPRFALRLMCSCDAFRIWEKYGKWNIWMP